MKKIAASWQVAGARTARAKQPAKRTRLAEDLMASLEEAVRWARGEKTDVNVHTVIPSAVKARKARLTLGLSRPKKVRGAIKGR